MKKPNRVVVTIHDILRQRCFDIAPDLYDLSLPRLGYTEKSKEFRKLKNNRLIMGALRYGLIGAKNKADYDRIKGIKKHLKLYMKTGNLEHLVDVSNIAECEFVEGKHPKRHFKANDDSFHVKKKGGK